MLTIPDTENYPGRCMAPDSPIGGHEAMETWSHGAMEGHRMPSGAMHDPDYFSLSRLVHFLNKS